MLWVVQPSSNQMEMEIDTSIRPRVGGMDLSSGGSERGWGYHSGSSSQGLSRSSASGWGKTGAQGNLGHARVSCFSYREDILPLDTALYSAISLSALQM